MKNSVAYLSNICTDLPDLRQELYASHPLIEAQSSLAREIVEVRYQAFHNVFQSWIGALRVYEMDIVGDVFDGEIL